MAGRCKISACPLFGTSVPCSDDAMRCRGCNQDFAMPIVPASGSRRRQWDGSQDRKRHGRAASASDVRERSREGSRTPPRGRAGAGDRAESAAPGAAPLGACWPPNHSLLQNVLDDTPICIRGRLGGGFPAPCSMQQQHACVEAGREPSAPQQSQTLRSDLPDGDVDTGLAAQAAAWQIADPVPVPTPQSASQCAASDAGSRRADVFPCPVPDCGLELQSFPTLRAHVDEHLLGHLSGLPPDSWLQSHNLVPCADCGCTVSRRCNNGVHRTCLARRQRLLPNPVASPVRGLRAEDWDIAELDEMPSFDEIALAPLQTRDFVGEGLFPKAEQQFNRCVSKVLLYNCIDDHDFIGTAWDTVARRRSRMAWLELWMFCKVCFTVLPGGKSKQSRNNNILSSRLDRWAAGERLTLWRETCSKIRTRKQRQEESEEAKTQRRQKVATELARRALPGKAMQRLSGPGLAKDTPEIERIMRSKFVPPPPHQHLSSRPLAPEANYIDEADVIKAVRSFPRGAGAGPTGMRPDFLRQIIGEGSEPRPGAALLTSLVNLLADGRASSQSAGRGRGEDEQNGRERCQTPVLWGGFAAADG